MGIPSRPTDRTRRARPPRRQPPAPAAHSALARCPRVRCRTGTLPGIAGLPQSDITLSCLRQRYLWCILRAACRRRSEHSPMKEAELGHRVGSRAEGRGCPAAPGPAAASSQEGHQRRLLRPIIGAGWRAGALSGHFVPPIGSAKIHPLGVPFYPRLGSWQSKRGPGFALDDE